MIFSCLWERYFIKEISKIFFLFLTLFFFLYAVLDYSMHMKDFVQENRLQVGQLLIYYGCQFIKRADLLIPLALLIATIKVLTSLNASRELVALLASGLRLTTLLRPFFIAAIACCAFNYLSFQFFVPQALNFIDHFGDNRDHRKDRLRALYLKDGSKLIYQAYDTQKDAYFDVIWIRSVDDIWRIKYLKADPALPIGECVDHLKRNSQGYLEKLETYDTYRFDALKQRQVAPRKGYLPPENFSFTDLVRKLGTPKPEFLTHFLFKTLMPLLSILVILGMAPFCVGYSRNLKAFFLYAGGLFSFIAFFTLMDAAVILGVNNVLSPIIIVLVPFLAATGTVTWKFIKTIK